MANRSDNFNRADSATSIGAPSDGGSGWTVSAGTWGITGNTLYRASGSGYAVAYLDAGVSAGTVSAKMTAAASAGIAMRVADGTNFVWLQCTGGTVYLWKRVAGTFTQLGSTYSGGYTTGDTFSLTVDSAGNWVAKKNSTSIITATDNVHNTATGVGFGWESNSATWDDFGFAEVDTTAPTLTSPSGTGGTVSCSGSVSTNESGGTLYAVVTASATAPTAAQVKLGQDDTGAAALRAVSQAVSATGTQSIASGSVTAGTRYIHFMHEDAAANQSTVASSASFTVTSGGDTTAPVLTSPSGTATGSTTATVGATTDEGNGTLYVVVTTSATQPSVAQIKAGQNNGGTAAAYASSQAVSSTGAKTFSATGLTASTTYYAHLVHADAAANDSNRVTSASFTTSAASVYGFDFDTITGLVFGDLAGALTSLARQTSVSIVARAYNASTGALVATSGTLTTDSNGRLSRWQDAALANATAYVVTFTRSSDGEVCAARLTTT